LAEIDAAALELAANAVYREGKSVIEVANTFDMSDMMRAFINQRQKMLKLLAGLTEAQVNYNPDTESYSLSEIFTHVIAAQGNTYNAFIDISESTRPHIDPVPREAGGGAEKGETAARLVVELDQVTRDLQQLIDETYDPVRDEHHVKIAGFGEMNQKAFLLLQLLHDDDHFRQARTTRRSRLFPKSGRTAALPPL